MKRLIAVICALMMILPSIPTMAGSSIQAVTIDGGFEAITFGSKDIGKEEKTEQETEQEVSVSKPAVVPVFGDVNRSDWYYETVTEMAQEGLFAGKGDNLFCPDDTMTRAEFITVVGRILENEERISPTLVETSYGTTLVIVGNAQDPDDWWKKYYNEFVFENIIREREFAQTEMNHPMTREEMALVIKRTLSFRDEDDTVANPVGVVQAISDYQSIGTYYKSYVVSAYAKGILCGVDAQGSFNPQGALTRAEAATVLYRLLDVSERMKQDFPVTEADANKAADAITIYEGAYRNNRNAKEGDVFIKADGSALVLKKDQYGVLGGGQGVAADVGLYLGGAVGNDAAIDGSGDRFYYNVHSVGDLYDSTGKHLSGQAYRVNSTTGEGYWDGELDVLTEAMPEPDYEGSYNGEISNDPYKLWVWTHGMWIYNCGKIQENVELKPVDSYWTNPDLWGN